MPLVSRQPTCVGCGHEDHHSVACECGCPPHLPTGIYPKES